MTAGAITADAGKAHADTLTTIIAGTVTAGAMNGMNRHATITTATDATDTIDGSVMI
jgi:hypothetical protein